MTFDPAMINQARQEIISAPHGLKTAKAKQWAILFDLSMQHLYRVIGDPVKKRKRIGQAIRPEYQEWATIIFQIKKLPPEEAGEISTEDAAAIAIKQGLIPAEASDVPVGTYDRIARDKGWTKKTIRANRFQAAKPNQAHHFDASTSKFLYIHKRIGDDFILRIHRPSKHYKNKPVPVDQLRPWIYGLVDDHSGRMVARYVAAMGENSGDSMSFLSWAWSDIGLPEQLLADQGMLKKALPSRDLIERLGVELPECMPYAKRAHGKIERPWRTLWQKFELTFFAQHPDYEKFEISLSEMNTQLFNFIEDKYNKMAHRFERNITRMQAWSRINLHGGIVEIPANALSTVARRAKRKVDVDGTLEYNGVTYDVKGLYDAWVYVFEGVFDDKLVVQDIETGKKYEVRNFKPLGLGEYKAHKETPHQKLVEESQTLPLQGAGLYSEKQVASEKVAAMPIRTKEERVIEDPFDVDTYPSIHEAMKEFMTYIPGVYLSPEERREVEEAIEAKGLSRSFVENLALEVRANMSKREAM